MRGSIILHPVLSPVKRRTDLPLSALEFFHPLVQTDGTNLTSPISNEYPELSSTGVKKRGGGREVDHSSSRSDEFMNVSH